MADFLFRARNAAGMTIEDRIEAATMAQARYKLELGGCRDIEFYSSDNDADIHRAALSGTGIAPETFEQKREMVRVTLGSQRRRGVLAHVAWAFGQHFIFFGPLLLWNFFSWRGSRPFGWGDRLGFAATGLYTLFFLVLVLPMTIFQQMLEAAVWRDWPKQRRCIMLARVLRRLMRTGIPENELRLREANALAAQGNLSGALEHVASLRGHPDLPEYMLLSRLGSIHEYAGDFAGQLRCAEQAAAAAPDKTDVWIDLALVRMRHHHDAVGARDALDRVAEREFSELQRAAFQLADGMVRLETGDPAGAEKELLAAEATLAKFGNPLIQSFNAELQANLAMAEARQGRAAEGKQRFARVQPLLEAQKADKLIGRVTAALS